MRTKNKKFELELEPLEPRTLPTAVVAAGRVLGGSQSAVVGLTDDTLQICPDNYQDMDDN